jgi:hypothetical protein
MILRKSILMNGLLVAASVFTGLMISELAVRVLAPQRLISIRPIYEPDPDLVFKLRENYRARYSQPEFEIYEQTNSIGLRDREIGPKQPGTYRILGLGDSFSYSNSVNLEQTYFKQVEACLTTSGSEEVEVINAAVPAYTPIQELRYLKKYGILLNPDAVILGFYAGNDFEGSEELFDSLGNPTVRVVDGRLRFAETFPLERYTIQDRWRNATYSLRAFFSSKSHLYALLLDRFSEALWQLGLRNNPPPPDFCAREYPPHTQRGWEETQQLLMGFKTFCEQRDIRLIVLALPTQYQVDEELWEHHFSAFQLDPALYDLDKPQRLLMEFCRGNEIEYVDVLETMRNAKEGMSLFYPVASYMTPAGHQVVSDVLCGYLGRGPARHAGTRETSAPSAGGTTERDALFE